ncbi:helix-turn-helix domain-containing protein [Herpetosiphon gulosus]|uniref:Helix-turn-helix domain-containing protein n=1 Tax=Herpetosiphon gulosus TaxID=1973496 RepID=A0ABP9X5V5_9CHLR
MSTLLSTKGAAERLGISRRRVICLITDQRLPAMKIGREWIIQEADLALVAHRKNGAPRKQDRKEAS